MKQSARTLVPVLDFPRTAPGLAERARDPRFTILKESGKSGGQGVRPRTRACEDVSVRGELSARDQRRDTIAARQEQAEVMGDISNRVNAAATPREQHAAVDLDTPPVLNWWRSQRLTASDGGVVQAVGMSQNELSGRPAETNEPEIGSCSPALKTANGKPDDQEEPWTKAQLHSLRRAQADTTLSASDFWGAVASNVKDRDPQQCQHKWFEHFVTPRGRRKKTSKQGSTCQSKGMTLLTDNTSRLSQENVAATHDSPERINQWPGRGDCDDLFQATPMRGRGQVGTQPAGGELEAKTPRTPAGPGVPKDYASEAEAIPGDGRAHGNQRGVSRTYVKAMSKKMRKGALQLGKNSMVTRERAKNTPLGSAGRTIHAATTSRGHRLKVSVTSFGDVSLALTCSDEDSVGLSGSCESEDERT